MKKIEYLIKHNRFIQLVYRIFFSTLFSIITFFIPVRKNLVLISSFSGKRFNDSPKVIFEAMKERGLLEKYDVVWALDDIKKFPGFPYKFVKISSFKYFLTAFRAKYWITNVNIERGLQFKKRNQIYLNTWHGTGPKTGGNAATGRKDYNFKKVNYLCADGEFLKKTLIRDFKAKEESIMLCGRPREDILYNPDGIIVSKFKEKYGIESGDFVILYAPTWREPKKGCVSTFNLELDVQMILDKIPNSKILFRSHSITENFNLKQDFDNRFISAIDELDIDDLFLISDVLITDYSSASFDFIILNKPFICFAPDYDEYIKQRKLYFDIKNEYPFGVQTTTEEVITKLVQIQNGDSKLDEFKKLREKYCVSGGHATETCIDKLFGLEK